MKKDFTNHEQLPLSLNAEQVAQVLGISRAGAYQLMHSDGFPVLRIGKRLLTPKFQLIAWIAEQSTGGVL